ncbi:DUF4314 domain-containing protein [Facklamia languida]
MQEIIEKLKKQYPPNSRIRLIEMDDVQSPPIGTLGTVLGVDDLGSLLVHWDNGSSLNVLDGIDKVSRVKSE